jgi:hypothetical protein
MTFPRWKKPAMRIAESDNILKGKKFIF